MEMDRQTAEALDMTQQTEYVPRKERWAFYASAFFRDMSYSLMGQTSYFYTDILGLKGFKLALLEWSKRIWDGVNDPLVGAYFDKQTYKDEKARKFFRRTSVPAALLMLFMFLPITFSADDNMNTWLRMGFVLLCYIPFEAMHTLSGTSFMSYYNSISPNIQERDGIISHSRLFSNLGTGAIGGLVPILLGFVAKDNVQGKAWMYLISAILVSLAFVIFNYLMYNHVKERNIVPPAETQTVMGIVKSMFQNKLFLVLIASNAIGGLISAGNTGMWFYDYNLGSTFWLPLIGIAGLPALLLASWLSPKLSERFEKRNLVIALGVAQILINLLYLAVGYQSKTFIALIMFLQNIPGALRGMLYWSMIADSVDHAEWSTGKRNDGIVYAAEGLVGKLVGAFGSTSTAIIIHFIKFQENAPTQSPETMKGLFYVPLVIGIISTAVGLIPYFFYNMKRADHAKIIEELKARKEAATPVEA